MNKLLPQLISQLLLQALRLQTCGVDYHLMLEMDSVMMTITMLDVTGMEVIAVLMATLTLGHIVKYACVWIPMHKLLLQTIFQLVLLLPLLLHLLLQLISQLLLQPSLHHTSLPQGLLVRLQRHTLLIQLHTSLPQGPLGVDYQNLLEMKSVMM